MTGFGNNAFDVLLKSETIDLVAVFTPRRFQTPFPYYQCEPLQETVSRYKNIQLFEDVSMRSKDTFHLIQQFGPDLIVVSTFDQIIPQEIISIPRIGVINIHPSLLPKYRGPAPTVWVLMNGEEETGVSSHFIEDERIDSGRIIAQSRLGIDAVDTNGTLRFKLAKLSEEVLFETVTQVLNKGKEKFPKQDESRASYYPKPSPKDAEIDVRKPMREILNKIRAMTPYPGAYLKLKGSLYLVRNASIAQKGNSHISLEETNRRLFIKTSEGNIGFEILKKDNNGKENQTN
jgi:methionyl-tRNA formyltransferase